MPLKFTRIRYKDLNARQQENYNYQRLSAVLAEYGFVTMRLSDDWEGADLIAQHIKQDTFLKIQLKGRLTFCKKYLGKSIYIAFRRGNDWYIYPHDELLAKLQSRFQHTLSWSEKDDYSYPKLTKQLIQILNPYLIDNRQQKLPLQD